MAVYYHNTEINFISTKLFTGNKHIALLVIIATLIHNIKRINIQTMKVVKIDYSKPVYTNYTFRGKFNRVLNISSKLETWPGNSHFPQHFL